jgi:hypothetical protein
MPEMDLLTVAVAPTLPEQCSRLLQSVSKGERLKFSERKLLRKHMLLLQEFHFLYSSYNIFYKQKGQPVIWLPLFFRHTQDARYSTHDQ